MGRIRSTSFEGGTAAFAVPVAIQDVLANWGRWAAVRAGCSRKVCPMFALYRSADKTADPRPVPVPVDTEQAWLVEKVVCNPEFAPRSRQLLTAHYVFESDMRATCRTLAIHRSEYERELWKASFFFWNRFKKA